MSLTVGEAIEMLNSNQKTMAELGQEFSTDRQVLPKYLRYLGYEKEGKNEPWYFKGEGESPNDMPFQDMIDKYKGRGGNKNTRKTPKVTANVRKEPKNTEKVSGIMNETPNLSANDRNDLTNEEINDLRQLLKEWKQNQIQSDQRTIHEKMKALKVEDKSKKTYYISSETIKNIDQFAKEENLKVGDLVNLALIELLERYKK